MKIDYMRRCKNNDSLLPQKNKTLIKIASGLLSLLALVACSAGDSAEETESQPGESAVAPVYSVDAPAWAGAVSFTQKDSTSSDGGGITRAEAVSTMYVDSYDENFGAVTKITAYAEDNDFLPYDIFSCKNSKERVYYLFLPCSADLSNVRVRTLHKSGCETGAYTLDFTQKEYGVRVGDDYYAVVAMQSNIPSLLIQLDEEEGSVGKMNSDASHSTYCYGDMTLVVTDELAAERGWKTEYTSRENDRATPGTIKMRGRGNWTWNQQKKPYQITLEKKTDLLGMGKAKNYLLLANVMDASLLRDQIFYDLADEMGLAYSPDIEPVDVFLNGEYIGSYSLSEKVEVGENRVSIDEDEDFLLELDHYYMNEVYTFTTGRGKNFTMHNQENSSSLSKIRDIMNEIEKSVYDEESDGYKEYLDVESWVKYWWLQDLSRNNDTFIGSNYFYYVASEGKLYSGPVWDMDNTLGIWGSGENLLSKGWHSDDRGWLGHLFKNDSFYAELVNYYVNGGLRGIFEALPDKIDGYAEYIRKSAEMNYIVNKKQYFVDCGCETFDDDIEYLKDFITDRLEWYDRRIGQK